MRTLRDLAADLPEGRLRARDLVEACLASIADPDGEGAHAFIAVHAQTARATADFVDALRANGAAPTPGGSCRIPASVNHAVHALAPGRAH